MTQFLAYSNWSTYREAGKIELKFRDQKKTLEILSWDIARELISVHTDGRNKDDRFIFVKKKLRLCRAAARDKSI